VEPIWHIYAYSVCVLHLHDFIYFTDVTPASPHILLLLAVLNQSSACTGMPGPDIGNMGTLLRELPGMWIKLTWAML
jgi:hypothetical protein